MNVRARVRLIDRNANTINICEIKYSKSLFALDSNELQIMQNRMDTFMDDLFGRG